MTLDFGRIEEKWQRRWDEERLHESVVDNTRPSFFLIFAYPGVTGYLHVGHMRGYTVSDAICRYKRMTGYNVLFPMGTHATGNGAIAFAKRVERRDERTLSILRENRVSEEEITKLSDPNAVVSFFNNVYLNDYWKRFGFLSDWRRFTCTINPDYQKFIEWQMLKLHQRGLLIQKPYFAPSCPEHGPVAIDASETDLQKGGTAELVEYVALKFKMGDKYLLAGTLRPETIFGLTNFWVNPVAEYVVADVAGESWILSRQGADKLRFQRDDVIIEGRIPASELIGTSCMAPHTGKEIPILPSELVDPGVGTGLVMSVPSDAPYDWMGIVDLRDHPEKLGGFNVPPGLMDGIEPIPIIKTPGWGPLPAVEICEKMGVRELADPKLEEATREIYRSGFHKGLMAEIAGEYAGRSVEEAKDELRELLLGSGEATLFLDLSEEVVCRCGKPVMIKKIPDQWFINYADPELTESSKEQAREMNIYPREYFENIQGILGWFRERACVRQGNWLGTRFPLDGKWIVEAIADSTLYPLYYILSLYANQGDIRPEQMTEAFFDHLLLDIGDSAQLAESTGISEETLREIKHEIEYWYPLSINLGGKEHMTVHFPVFLMNHVAILPRRFWPRGIIVNWYITGSGEKISKSKGGAQPIPGAARRFGVDSMRLYYAHIASLYVDVAWEDEKVENYRSRLLRIAAHVDEILDSDDSERRRIDDWMLSRLNARISNAHEAMRSYDIRSFANEVYYELPSDIRWYSRRGGGSRDTLVSVIDAWIRLMTPITPHLAEELWERLKRGTLVSRESIPEPSDDRHDSRAESEERYLRSVSSDIGEILRVIGIEPKRIVLTTAPEWKRQVAGLALATHDSGDRDIGSVIKKAMSLPSTEKKELAGFVKSLMSDLHKMSREEIDALRLSIDEREVLESAADFLSSEHGGAEIVIQSADNADKYDPAGRAKTSRPMRPSIFAE